MNYNKNTKLQLHELELIEDDRENPDFTFLVDFRPIKKNDDDMEKGLVIKTIGELNRALYFYGEAQLSMVDGNPNQTLNNFNTDKFKFKKRGFSINKAYSKKINREFKSLEEVFKYVNENCMNVCSASLVDR